MTNVWLVCPNDDSHSTEVDDVTDLPNYYCPDCGARRHPEMPSERTTTQAF